MKHFLLLIILLFSFNAPLKGETVSCFVEREKQQALKEESPGSVFFVIYAHNIYDDILDTGEKVLVSFYLDIDSSEVLFTVITFLSGDSKGYQYIFAGEELISVSNEMITYDDYFEHKHAFGVIHTCENYQYAKISLDGIEEEIEEDFENIEEHIEENLENIEEDAETEENSWNIEEDTETEENSWNIEEDAETEENSWNIEEDTEAEKNFWNIEEGIEDVEENTE